MRTKITPSNVHEVLGQHILASGMDVVLDLDKSHGNWLHDARTNTDMLDMFTFYASRPLSYDHPALTDASFQAELGRVAAHKPSNCDVYTVEYARFVDAFMRTAGADFRYMFAISGGALAVENALKCAFDWKVRKNLAAGRGEVGGRILHFSQAFHGRSGYTLSLTDSPDPRKTLYFPKFDWPRVHNPSARFPLSGDNLAATIASEERSLAEIEQAFAQHPHDIAGILIEPIQGEGGDNHFRREFLAHLRTLADRHEALLIFDEVQTGMGITGEWWAHQRIGVKPDLAVFGKKFQVCGFVATERVEEVEGHVFVTPSRISSTFEGNLTDMVRCTRVLEVIETEGLLANVKTEGEWLIGALDNVATHDPRVDNVRGLGLFVAFDLPDTAVRDRFLEGAQNQDMILLGCGARSVRFRPSLDVKRSELETAIERVRATLAGL